MTPLKKANLLFYSGCGLMIAGSVLMTLGALYAKPFLLYAGEVLIFFGVVFIVCKILVQRQTRFNGPQS
jgi:hypothetical protein